MMTIIFTLFFMGSSFSNYFFRNLCLIWKKNVYGRYFYFYFLPHFFQCWAKSSERWYINNGMRSVKSSSSPSRRRDPTAKLSSSPSLSFWKRSFPESRSNWFYKPTALLLLESTLVRQLFKCKQIPVKAYQFSHYLLEYLQATASQ